MPSQPQSADYPNSLHSEINSSGFDGQYLGSSTPTLGEAVEKLSKEVKAIQDKLGVGASLASSANTGYRLTKQSDGTVKWQAPVIIAHDSVSDDTAPGKLVGGYNLAINAGWQPYPGGAAYDLQLPASVGDWVLVRMSGFANYLAIGSPSDIGTHGYGVSSIDGSGNAIQSIFGSTGVATTFGITVHMHDGGEGGFTLVGERQVIAGDLIGGNITLRIFYIALETGVGGGSITLWADEQRNFRFEAEIRRYP